MAYSARPTFYESVAGAPQFSARVLQREVGSSGRVKLKRNDNYLCTKCELWGLEDWQRAKERRGGGGGRQCQRSGRQFVPDEATTPRSELPSVPTRRPLLSPAKTYLETDLSPGDKVWVIAASTSEELLAAATLRAQIFYSYPQADIALDDGGVDAAKARVAHDFLVNDLLKTRVKSEFNRESKFEALGMRVKCLLAVCRQSALETLASGAGAGGGSVDVSSLSHLAPLSVSSVDMDCTQPLVAIGTLDMQVHKGKKKAKECFPMEQENTLEQAYIFNLCVVRDARRMGVAKALMLAALKVAKQEELKILFVHVEVDNASALALYKSLGYAVDEEFVEVHKGKKRAKECFPMEKENTLEQAYIFNLCVIRDAWRMGVAKALMLAALKVAKQEELKILFVHVEAESAKETSNTAAKFLGCMISTHLYVCTLEP